jgi:hypothetical protein
MPDNYDLETLTRFIDGVFYNRPSNDQGFLTAQKQWREQRGIPEQAVTNDMLAATYALIDALHGVDLRKKYKLHLCQSVVDLRQSINSPVTAYVRACLNGEIKRHEAIDGIAMELGIGEKKAEEFYYQVKQAQQNTLDSFKRIFAMMGRIYTELQKQTKEEEAEDVYADKKLGAYTRCKRIQDIYECSWEDAKQRIAEHKRKKP